MKDTIIIGAGVAGLSAALFAARHGLSVLILSKDLGGQTASTAEIENYPGHGRVEGPALVQDFLEQAKKFGAELALEEVVSVSQDSNTFFVKTTHANYHGTTVILACGKTPRSLGVPGEIAYAGRGVHYSSVFDPLQYTGKAIAVVGGGNSALEAAYQLDRHALRVFLIHRRDVWTGEQILVDRVAKCKNAEKIFDTAVEKINGDARVESITIRNLKSQETRTLAVDGICIATGFEPRTGFLNNLVTCTSAQHVIVDECGATSCPGVFAAGDITAIPYQQIVISAGEGAKAALSAYHYLAKLRGTRAKKTDWGYLS